MKFIKSVVEDEYPAMAQLKKSDRTQEAINELWLNIAIIKPKTSQEQVLYSKMLRNLEALVDLRRSRLGEMGSSVPDILWAVISTGARITIFLATLIRAENFWTHARAISMIVIVIANTIYLVIELDYPFLGEVSARPASYMEILKVCMKKDQLINPVHLCNPLIPLPAGKRWSCKDIWFSGPPSLYGLTHLPGQEVRMARRFRWDILALILAAVWVVGVGAAVEAQPGRYT